MTIGELTKVPLRELWSHEQRGFSAWLVENIDVLAEALGITLTDPQREESVGSFSVDVVAESDDSNRVIIENQLEPTDHDHLGKVLTYLTNLDAKAAIWITSRPRPEHIRAVSWLNETTPDDVSFHLVQLAAYRIGDSDAAPLFTPIVGPSAEAKGFGRQKKDLAERHLLRFKYWEGLLDRAKQMGVMLHSNRSPWRHSWIGTGAGKSGLAFNYVIWKDDRAAVELYIDTGDRDENKQIFDALHQKQEEVEQAFGAPVDWERLDEKRASRIRFTIHKGGLASGEKQWPIIWEEQIQAMQRLAQALKPHLPRT